MSLFLNLEDFINKHVVFREKSLFEDDIALYNDVLQSNIEGKKVLVIGGAGSIGSSFIKQLIPFKPKALYVVDNNENGLAELTRDLRSDALYTVPEQFVTYPMSIESSLFKKFFSKEKRFDIVANFAAHKHVRSEKDAISVEAMITNNVLSAYELMQCLKQYPPSHFFCVSTDKATNPVNIMGASKKMMEQVIFMDRQKIPVKTARFANVAFSNGSLPAAFLERISKKQPLSAPLDVKRYFISPKESGQICLLACIVANAGEIVFPKLEASGMISFDQIAISLLKEIGYTPLICKSEDEAKAMVSTISSSKQYPVYFFHSDTTGEKSFEEFFAPDEQVNWSKFRGLGVIENQLETLPEQTLSNINRLRKIFEKEAVTKEDIVKVLADEVNTFHHMETGKYLDQKM